MITFKLFVTIYLFGGITFIPLVVLTLLYFNKRSENEEQEVTGSNAEKLLITGLDPEFKAGELEESKGVEVRRKGWLTVTKKYYYHHNEVKELMEKHGGEVEVPQRSQLKKRHRFYAVLRHGNLFLYRDDAPKSNLVHAISLQDSFVTIWPRDTANEAPDAGMFTKRTCISILRDGTATYDGMLHFHANASAENNSSWSQFFLYFDNNNIEKEDWYFDLINVSKREPKDNAKPTNVIDPNNCARTAHLRTPDALYLVQAIHSTEGQLTTQWFNALLGRLFLSLQRTDTLKDFIYGRLYKKLTKLNKPGFLDDFVIEEVDVGNSAPMITNPKLLELSPTGLTRISLDMQYKGNLSVNIATNVTINLGSHFRQRQVPVQLSIKIKELTGPMFLTVKPPPSNRLWYTFQTEPIFDVEIQPVVSSSKLSYGMITKAIKGKLFEAIKESLVVPYWDDFAFYNTEDEIYRAGIWEKHEKDFNQNNSHHEEEKVSSQNFEVHKDQEDEDDESSSSDEPRTPEKPARGDFLGNERSDSIDSDSISRTKSSDSMKTQDPTLKSRTLQKVGNIKRAWTSKSKEDLDNEHAIVDDNFDNLSNAGDREGSRDSADSKKYFKNSLRKIGQWYRGTPNSSVTSDGEKSNQGSINHPPEMISNRRKPLPKRPIPPPLNNNPTSPTSVSNSSFSPTLNATEMFANKSRSHSNMSSETNDPVVSPNLPTHDNVGFVKPQRSTDFPEELYTNKLEDSNDTTKTDTESTRSSGQGIDPSEIFPKPHDHSDNGREEAPNSASSTIGPNETL
ncbi:hypothetical protein ZYGR_0I07330 [Zygosaccharomyces rouxii]|uniref:SMP-LTD domain-containing protein n=1 Tax=Zygosaccharomyces rouxii TaxID=4956 RepID=A0A1Q2ZYA3_ZYGRO|nr:hypothetical protein ZYGR_0I07330 [Zygosaccharomyces rouxii]